MGLLWLAFVTPKFYCFGGGGWAWAPVYAHVPRFRLRLNLLLYFATTDTQPHPFVCEGMFVRRWLRKQSMAVLGKFVVLVRLGLFKAN